MLCAEREGTPFFAYRAPTGDQQIIQFGWTSQGLTVGRNPAADLSLEWDKEVSAVHAELRRLADELTLVDDGLSRNGSYVNGERVAGRRRLSDGDMLRFGRTLVLVRIPGRTRGPSTVSGTQHLLAAELSDQQRRVLIALCRPLARGEAFSTPATNHQIATELCLSIPAVKVHLRTLFEKFGVSDLPQNEKRTALAGRALESGILSVRELLMSDP